MRVSRLLIAFLGVLAVVGTAWSAEDVLKTYKKRFGGDAYLSEREAVLEGLAASGEIKALGALLWCTDLTRERIVDAEKHAEKVARELEPAREAYQEKYEKYAAQFEKQGKPRPKTHPRWPVRLKLDELVAQSTNARRRIEDERGLLALAIDAHGRLVAGLPAEDQDHVRVKWLGGPLAAKDWGVRARQWSLVGGVPTPWALEMLLAAAVEESDPRVLVKVLDGLAGRETLRILPVLRERMGDARWLVRVAAVAALERTPSKETVDALLEAMELEDGRLIDDCGRALSTLTGEEFGPNPARWRVWWDRNREAWTGPPEPPTEEDDATADAGDAGDEKEDGTSGADAADDTAAAEDEPQADTEAPRDSETGFFGIDTRSKRLVYVIDVSGSMNEKVGKKAERTRAELAKAELERAVLALEDGARFNMVFYSNDVRVWRKEMVTATRATRLEAVEFVRESAVVGGTATYDALVAAFDLGDIGRGKKRDADPSGDSAVDTVILLSDGRPTVGKLTNPGQIRSAIVELNQARRIAVHTVAFGKDADLEFMEGLAKDTGGTFVSQ